MPRIVLRVRAQLDKREEEYAQCVGRIRDVLVDNDVEMIDDDACHGHILALVNGEVQPARERGVSDQGLVHRAIRSTYLHHAHTWERVARNLSSGSSTQLGA